MDLSELVTDCRRRTDRRRGHHPLAAELAKAIERDSIEIAYQPQFTTADGTVLGAEALARWRHDQFGEMAGDALFEIADMSDLSARLSAHIHDQALQAAASWRAGLRLSLNVTAFDLLQPDFADSLARSLAKSGFSASALTLELTEQVLVGELHTSAERLTELVGMGASIALDDFGAGFCNFNYLKRLPLHCLKLDRSMVVGIAEDERDLAVLRAIVAMARALDLEVIAEGIETEAQRDAVQREGCNAWQGFLGAKPMSADEFDRFLAIHGERIGRQA